MKIEPNFQSGANDTAGEVSSELKSSSPELAPPASDVVDLKPLDLSRPSIIVPTRS